MAGYVRAPQLAEDVQAELELLRRNVDESTPGPWIQRSFDALAMAKGNATRVELLEGSIELLLHAIDCGDPLFGTTRCAVCAAVHDEACGEKEPTKAHESRWCSGNVYQVALTRLRAARRGEAT